MKSDSWDEKIVIEFVYSSGKVFTPAVVPEDIRRGKVGDCFDTSLLNAVHNRKYRYVEGIAMHPTLHRYVFHAWLTDEEGENAYDPTWRVMLGNQLEMPMITTYIGFPIGIDEIAKFVSTTEYKSVLANGWRNPELAQKCIPELPCI